MNEFLKVVLVKYITLKQIKISVQRPVKEMMEIRENVDTPHGRFCKKFWENSTYGILDFEVGYFVSTLNKNYALAKVLHR